MFLTKVIDYKELTGDNIMAKLLTNSKILIINKQRSGFSAAQKNMAKSHQDKFGVVAVRDAADADAPEYAYVECDPQKRKAQIALAEIAKVKAKAALAKDKAAVADAPAICEKLPPLIEKVSSDGSRSWGFATGIFGG